MGLVNFLKIFVAKFLSVLAWPSFTLVCPLVASIRVVESEAGSNYQQCLSYWVLFSITTILESALANLLTWFPLWPYAKGIAILLLVTSDFGGACYAYVHFIRPYLCSNSQIGDILFIKKAKLCMPEDQNDFLDASKGYVKENGHEELNTLFMFEDESVHKHDLIDEQPTGSKNLQREWSCALCLVTTSSEKCLRRHLRGKMHKAKQEEHREDQLLAKRSGSLPLTIKKTDGMILLGGLSHFTWSNMGKLSGILSPVVRSIRWCSWEKPEFGWTKLNTDGSIDTENAGFGGLLRDYKGKPICAYVTKAPREDDIFLVELWAIWRGLVLALSLRIKVIWVESDSLSVVKTIKKEQPYGGPRAASCLKTIWALLKKFDQYRISHTWRETNRAADHLAKMNLPGSDVVLWPVDFPVILHKIIKEDAQGRRYKRA